VRIFIINCLLSLKTIVLCLLSKKTHLLPSLNIKPSPRHVVVDSGGALSGAAVRTTFLQIGAAVSVLFYGFWWSAYFGVAVKLRSVVLLLFLVRGGSVL
jgi:hypothetical protein